MNFDDLLITQLDDYKNRLEKINFDLSLEEVLLDQKLSIKLEKEKNQITPIVEKYQQLVKMQQQLKNLSENEKQKLQNEVLEDENKIENLKSEIINLLSTIKKNYQSVTVEIINQSEQSDKLCNYIFESYKQIFDNEKYDFEQIEIQKEDIIKKIVLSISGENVFDKLSQENGIHKTESQSVQVLIYPKIEKKTYGFDEKDIKIDIYRSNGAGGQNVNKVSTAIRVTHKETGIVSTCQDERSQFQNKERALENLKRKIEEQSQKEFETEQKKQRQKYQNKSIIKIYDFNKKTIIDNQSNCQYEMTAKQIENNLKIKQIRS